jgi:hypothetical protein
MRRATTIIFSIAIGIAMFGPSTRGQMLPPAAIGALQKSFTDWSPEPSQCGGTQWAVQGDFSRDGTADDFVVRITTKVNGRRHLRLEGLMRGKGGKFGRIELFDEPFEGKLLRSSIVFMQRGSSPEPDDATGARIKLDSDGVKFYMCDEVGEFLVFAQHNGLFSGMYNRYYVIN